MPAKGGTVVIDRAAKTGRADIEFDPNAIATGVPKFDDHLRSPDFFEVEKHPTATFKSSRMTFDEQGAPKTVEGELTIKGISKPVTLEVTTEELGELASRAIELAHGLAQGIPVAFLHVLHRGRPFGGGGRGRGLRRGFFLGQRFVVCFCLTRGARLFRRTPASY